MRELAQEHTFFLPHLFAAKRGNRATLSHFDPLFPTQGRIIHHPLEKSLVGNCEYWLMCVRRCPRRPISRILFPIARAASHLSGMTVAGHLVRPTRERGGEPPLCPRVRAARCLALLPMGDTWPASSPRPPVGPYSTFSPLPSEDRRRIVFCGPVPSDHSAWALPSIALYGVRTFLERLVGRPRLPSLLGRLHGIMQLARGQDARSARST